MPDDDFDYQAYTRDNLPNPAKIKRGEDAREQWQAAAMKLRAMQTEGGVFDGTLSN